MYSQFQCFMLLHKITDWQSRWFKHSLSLSSNWSNSISKMSKNMKYSGKMCYNISSCNHEKTITIAKVFFYLCDKFDYSCLSLRRQYLREVYHHINFYQGMPTSLAFVVLHTKNVCSKVKQSYDRLPTSSVTRLSYFFKVYLGD